MNASRRFVAAFVVCIAIVSPARADHAGDWVIKGRTAVNNPAITVGPGVSEYLAECVTDSPTDQIDGDVVELPAGADGHPARLEFSSLATADLSMFFYDAKCRYLEESGGMRSAGPDETENGYIPEFARFASIDAFLGSNIEFTLTVFLSKPSVLPDLGIPIPLDRMEPFEADVQPQNGSPVKIRGHVYIPEGSGPFATVLEYSPYWNWGYANSATRAVDRGSRTTIHGELRRFLEAGFAVALVNIRGSGISDGCLDWFGPLDRADTYTVIEALAAKPWSNGSVGMFGHSYPGNMAYVGAASGAPSLKAILPMSAAPDLWNYLSVRGVPYVHQYVNVFWKPAFSAAALSEENEGNNPLAAYRPECSSTIDEVTEQAPLWNGDRNAYYAERDLCPALRGSPVAVFATTGLRFWTTVEAGEAAGVMGTEDLREIFEGRARVMVGQWGHSRPSRPDFLRMSVDWFDHHLRGGPLTVQPGITEYEDDALVWRQTTSWPQVPDRTLHLTDVGLSEEPGATHAAFIGAGSPCMRVCVFDQTVDACIPNHVAYSTARFDEDVEMAGQFTLDLTVSSTMSDSTIVAYLIESDTGDCGDPTARIVARAATDLRHIRNEAGEDFPVGVPTDVTLRSMPFGTVLHAGKRLTLAIGGDGEEFRLAPDAMRAAVTITKGALHVPIG